MESVSRAVGSPLPIRLAGRWRLLDPLTLSDFGAMEMHLLHSRPSLVDTALSALESLGDEAEDLFLFAREQDSHRPHFVAGDVLNSYLQSAEGLAMSLWLMTRRREPTLSMEDITEECSAWTDREQLDVMRAVMLVSCLDEMADKDWITVKPDSGEGDQGKFNFKHVVRRVCESYFGVTPADVGRLTLYQLRMLTVAEGDVKGARVSRDEFRAMQESGRLDESGIRWVPKKGA